MTVGTGGDDRLVAGRYQLAERLGSGGMGVVWQAYDERLHRRVAVKQLLLPAGLTSEEAAQAKHKVMREGRIAAKLQHQHAIMIYDVAEHDGQPFLVMEYLPSKSLSEVLAERGTLPVDQVALIGTRVAAALASAHAVGVVHRDVKPGNVLLGERGQVKITDFGISRAVEDVTGTMTGIIKGTPAYLSPEVAQGHSATYASDVFSLGATLYTAIEGKPPFGMADNAIALLFRVASGQITPPRQAGPMTDLLLSLLRPDPAQRPTMAQASAALAELADDNAPTVVALPLTEAPPLPAAEFPPAAESPPAAGPLPAAGRTPEEETTAATSVMPAAGATPAAPAPPHAEAQHGPDPAGPGGQPAGRATAVAPPTASRQKPAPARRERRRRIAVLAAAAIALLALAGLLFAVWPEDNPGRSTAAQQPTSSAPEPTTASQQQAPPPPAPTSAAPPASQDPPATSAPDQPAPPANPPVNPPPAQPPAAPTSPTQAITSYYALMPGNLDEGWTRLTPAYQQGTAGGRGGYQRFWDQMQSVQVSDVDEEQGGTVGATVVYRFKSGRITEERHSYRLVSAQGRWLIDRHTVISSVTT